MTKADLYYQEFNEYWEQLGSYGLSEDEIADILMPTGAIPNKIRTREIERLEARAEKAISEMMENMDEYSDDILDNLESEMIENLVEKLDFGTEDIDDALREWAETTIHGLTPEERKAFFDEVEMATESLNANAMQYNVQMLLSFLNDLSASVGKVVPPEILQKIESSALASIEEYEKLRSGRIFTNR